MLAAAVVASTLLSGCAQFMSGFGPNAASVETTASSAVPLRGIEVVKVDYALAHAVEQHQQDARFSSLDAGPSHPDHVAAPGDTLAVFLWEAPPAMLFTQQSVAGAGTGVTLGGTGMISLPVQTVDNAGNIVVPFAGNVHVAGHTLQDIGQTVVARLRGMANQPQAMVELAANNTQNITVVGDVAHSMEVPLDPGGVTLLRAIALAGGVNKPISKVSIQLSREGRVMTMPLQTVLRDPRQNIPLRAGDVVTALYQPSSFTVLGAVGKNAEVDFEASGISLAQAIARTGGLDDNRANPSGVFVFRFVAPDSLPGLHPTHVVDGRVPVIFEFNLRDPGVFFAAQTFPVRNHDLLYVSDSPQADMQKVLNVVGAIVYPFSTLNAMGVIK